MRTHTKHAQTDVNGLLAHRKKQVIPQDIKAIIMPDAACAHQHEHKIKEDEEIELSQERIQKSI